jgi:hypothetical protein
MNVTAPNKKLDRSPRRSVSKGKPSLRELGQYLRSSDLARRDENVLGGI